ncbi:TPA: LacI family DNA-binding transcriptional regulator [Streptococcus equi subsp. zooepidemicus]|nr:LacI family DNA-binding transcriptional regulator [Streptococcus equi]HEL1012741.1 LacI family DNA-binding transcriptional regulator [Streptococcus equi subsp. ruminatorum]KED04724.1 ribose operon repressor [Streptococcus equi subsp. ruminatorum CECT 5772]KIQ75769.1 LacI family transcriptional regulator [Streptococcus equi subsp. zooepidemicus]MCD3398457.1 LacI family transcriptional regulator [Streptococcus equi subsp. zooepidemicus]MCD3424465.1 LacI family transcriptional regulator [Strep
MVTIKQVAKEAGLSKSTVSRYISQKGYVSEEARDRIKAAIEKLHYSPNLSAQSLKTKKNQLVGLLLPDISNPFFPRLARGAETFLKEKGYRVMLGNLSDNPVLEEEYLNVMRQSNAAGIITTHDFTKTHPEIDIPIVVVDRVNQETQFGVFSDNEEGGRLAAQKVCESGADHILLIRGPLDDAENLHERFEASLAYLQEAGVRTSICDSSSFDFEAIQDEAKQALADFPDLDSVIAPSDIHAIAYIHELHSCGKRIPEDVQVMGYDDILMSQFIYPSLSTIHQSSYLLGYKAAELVYQITNQLPIDEKRIKLPVHYVERETIRRKHE